MGEVELFKNALKAGLIEDPSAERLEEQELEEQRPEEQGKNGSEPDRVVEQEAPALIEALILASGEGLSQERIREVTKLDESVVESALKLLEEHYREAGRGFELVQAAGQYQFRTRACFAPHVQALKVDRPRRLTNAALETLAVIAYRQPIVKSDIEKIRGVDATPTLKTLLDRELIRIMGHKAAVGQPALYGTTERFLKLFGLNSLGELPTLRDLKDLENDPGEAGERLGELESEGSDEVVEQDEDMSGVAAQP